MQNKEEKVCSGHSLELQFIMVGKEWWQDWKAPSHIASTVKNTEREEMSHTPVHRMVSLTLRVEMPSQTCSELHSMKIPNFVKLIMNIRSQETRIKYLFHNDTGRKRNSELFTGDFP